MKRRDVLALCSAAAVGLAGCTSNASNEGSDADPTADPGTTNDDGTTGDGGTATPTPTSTTTPDPERRVPMGRTVEAGDARITVENPRVRKLVVHNGVHAFLQAHDGQYVVADVTTEGVGADDVGLRSSVGGDALEDARPVPTWSREAAAPRSAAEWDGARIAFPFPADAHEKAAVAWTTAGPPVRWELPAPVRETLAREPEFAIEDLRTDSSDGRLALEMAVANDGARAGRFVARVSMEGFSGGRIVAFDVPAGESRRYAGRANGLLTMFENSGGGTLTVEALDRGDLATKTLDVGVSEPTTGSRE